MSSTLTGPYPPVLVRADEAEHLDLIGHVLLADSSATAGALSSHRVALGRGADGAVPHRHDNSSELFYILDGAFDLLVADNVVTARTGDLLVVPPGSAHAFAAHRDSTGEALIIATPGIERFEYFRHVVRRREGSEPAEVLLGLPAAEPHAASVTVAAASVSHLRPLAWSPDLPMAFLRAPVRAFRYV